MGRYGAENSPYKVIKHFCLLLDGKQSCSLRRSGYVIFLVEGTTFFFFTTKTQDINKIRLKQPGKY